jgi:hypothetical protein
MKPRVAFIPVDAGRPLAPMTLSCSENGCSIFELLARAARQCVRKAILAWPKIGPVDHDEHVVESASASPAGTDESLARSVSQQIGE